MSRINKFIKLIYGKSSIDPKVLESHPNSLLALLVEYRTRLISDAVTGRLDVRNIFVPEYDAVAELEPVEDGDNGVDGVDDEPSDGSDGMVLP